MRRACQIQYHATNNIYENDIVYANKQALFMNNYTFKPLRPTVIDYNLYYSKAGDSNGNWTWEGKNYTGYDNYREKTGLDADSPPSSDPEFISTGNPPNLDIQPTSPAVNAGTNLGENVVGTVDFAGKPPGAEWTDQHRGMRAVARGTTSNSITGVRP